ncbi:MOSC domain-containing protein [Pelagophyceae sp. CCMP2097]|nr:MOSC domain-containing protein [Pelagophyceae sp. CCMP2097]|mmetsp:Transcript_22761/g.76957  ORF Transcript_22761/g.76957 Transcript_22761/m.76957 type:complete len:275 (-) Transcript_22761:16-840(-)
MGANSSAPLSSVAALHRFAVKGLERDELKDVRLEPGAAFPHDREWALRFADSDDSEAPPAWVHKSNFLCAFTANELLGGLEPSYDDATNTLSVKRRNAAETLLDHASLDTEEGRDLIEKLFSDLAGRSVLLVTGGELHQFGNTPAGFNASEDLRTIHLVNENTVAALSAAAGLDLHPERFRPNVILKGGLPAFAEFSWVGRKIRCGGAVLKVISRAVRCEACNVDARNGAPNADVDVPALLAQHFPMHGSYLGVYAQVVQAGNVKLDDAVTLVD